VEIVYPIPGTSTFTFVGTLGGEFFEKTIDVQVDVLDTPLNQDWYDLVSENTAEGKSLGVCRRTGGDEGLWWFMSPPDNPDRSYVCVVECRRVRVTCHLSDADRPNGFSIWMALLIIPTMQVPDAAGANRQFRSGCRQPVSSSLAGNGLECSWRRCTLKGYDIGRHAGTYQITSLTEDELILYVPYECLGVNRLDMDLQTGIN
jgi:hypothetical protein